MNTLAMSIETFESLPLTPALIADLQSDHAGEAGAVAIYRGMLAVSRDESVRRFAKEHIRTELRHLRFFESWLPARHRSRLMWAWRAAGWLLGATSALFGRQAAFRTVAAVETFVEGHYVAQIETMNSIDGLESLAAILQEFCSEEVHHREDASARVTRSGGAAARAWEHLIASGSALGVRIARRV